jgi:ABC-type nitrate/sulfonate/bicarbonate transport system permease component
VSSAAHRWALFAVVVVVWELVARALADPYFPPLSEIAKTAADLWFTGPASQLFLTDLVYDNVFPGVGRMLGSWAVAVVIGVAVGLLLGRSRTGMAYAGGTLNFLRAIPPPMLVAPFLVTLGLDAMTTGTIIFCAVWPVLLNTVEGARSVDSTKIDTARAFRLSKAQWVLGVVLPAALPKIFAGLRLSLSLAVILMVVSELIGGATYGIGYQLLSAQYDYELTAMWVWILLLSVLGYLFNTVLLIGERRALRWQNTLGGTA